MMDGYSIFSYTPTRSWCIILDQASSWNDHSKIKLSYEMGRSIVIMVISPDFIDKLIVINKSFLKYLNLLYIGKYLYIDSIYMTHSICGFNLYLGGDPARP